MTANNSSDSSGFSSQWDEEKVHFAIRERARRRMLFAMGRRGPQRAADLQGATNLNVSATLKHLDVLSAAGLVVRSADPKNGRHWLYGLAPTVRYTKTASGAEIDFEFVILRSKL